MPPTRTIPNPFGYQAKRIISKLVQSVNVNINENPKTYERHFVVNFPNHQYVDLKCEFEHISTIGHLTNQTVTKRIVLLRNQMFIED